MKEVYRTVISTFIINNNCVEITINADATFDLPIVVQHFEEIYAVIKKPYQKSIVDFSKISFIFIPKESMEYMANNKYTCDNSLLAIIINGLPQKLIGDFYLKMMKPKRKTKFFMFKQDAIEWLNTINEKATAKAL
jgi:hypothetical protein